MSELEQNIYKRLQVSSTSIQPKPSRAYRGFYSGNPSKGFNLYDHELIKQDIINHFHIRQGEKIGDPGFGCIIWDILFEPFTPALQAAIIENVTFIINYDPRVQAENVIVDSQDSGIQITATVKFLDYAISESMRFTFDKSVGLGL